MRSDGVPGATVRGSSRFQIRLSTTAGLAGFGLTTSGRGREALVASSLPQRLTTRFHRRVVRMKSPPLTRDVKILDCIPLRIA